MAKAEYNPNDDRFTRGLIQRKINQLIGRAGFNRQDGEDLEQELYVRILQSFPNFNSNVAHYNAYITTVVERHVANILRNKQAGKRDHRRISSLNVIITRTDEGPTELAQTIGDRELDARIGRHRCADEESTQLAIDMDSMIGTMPDQWQTLLQMRKTLTMSEICRKMGVPRTTLNDWMRRIRQRFEKSNMRDYL
jgi:RNA polymerase sigma factor (sigma-70 family)